MLIYNEEFKQEFEKRFSNFLKNAPIFATFEFVGLNEIEIYNLDNQIKKRFQLDDTLSLDVVECVKKNIYNIKENFLIKEWYPKIKQYKKSYRLYTPEEIGKLLEENPNQSIDKLLNKKISIVEQIPFVIEKVNLKEKVIFLRNLETSSVLKYKLKIPISILLSKINNLQENKKFEFIEKHRII